MTIDKNQINDGNAKAPTFSLRPELGISTNKHSDTQATDDRILSNLGSEPITKKPNGGVTNNRGIKFFSLLGISAIAAYAAFSGFQHLSAAENSDAASGAPDHSATPVTTVALAAAQPAASASASASASATAPAMAASVAPEAAQIVNTPSPAVASLPTSSPATTPDTLTKSLEEGVAPPVATLEKALTAKPPPHGPACAPTPQEDSDRQARDQQASAHHRHHGKSLTFQARSCHSDSRPRRRFVGRLNYTQHAHPRASAKICGASQA